MVGDSRAAAAAKAVRPWVHVDRFDTAKSPADGKHKKRKLREVWEDQVNRNCAH